MASIKAQFIKQLIKRSGVLRRELSHETLEQRRKEYALLARYFPMPPGVKSASEMLHDVSVEWFEPETIERDTLIVYVSGGGFVFESIHRGPIARLATVTKAKAISINYHVAPEQVFPTQLDEIMLVYKELLNEYEPQKIILIGDSAGANLITGTLVRLRDEGIPLPAGAVLISPFLDLTLSGKSITTNEDTDVMLTQAHFDFFVDAYLGKQRKKKHPEASPLHADLINFPPLLIQTDSGELLASDAQRFAAKAKENGVDVTLTVSNDLWHTWFLWAHMVPESAIAMKEIATFVTEVTNKK